MKKIVTKTNVTHGKHLKKSVSYSFAEGIVTATEEAFVIRVPELKVSLTIDMALVKKIVVEEFKDV